MTATPDFVQPSSQPAGVAFEPRAERARLRTRRGEPKFTRRANKLRRALVLVDCVTVTSAWALALSLPATIVPGSPLPLGLRTLALVALTLASLCVISAQHLYLARVCGVRSVELNRLALSAALVGGVVVVVVLPMMGAHDLRRIVIGSGLMFLFTAAGRSAYDAWIKTMRASGRFARRIVLVGANDESMELAHLLRDHPEFGYAPVGVVGDSADRVRWDSSIPWLGSLDVAADVVDERGASGALLAASALTPEELNRLTRDLLKRHVHVHLSAGLRGISHRRLRALPISHEPIFYLEPTSLPQWKVRVKRGLDLVLAALLLTLSLPLLIGAAIAIKLQDGGPILYRQVRVGRNGTPFTLLKLRTMRPDADIELQQVTTLNEREGGPLFKANQDPRRTSVGHFLELSSIDEIPQLVNVLRGQMSLVGPRPALPEEVARFDPEFWSRHDVPPGITGLWQVEARDNPSFAAYRRLDLFYVENWSVALDLAIILATVRTVLGRLFKPQAS